METNIEEALTSKSYAEKRFIERDYVGARSYALKAQMLCPELDGVAQMVATFGVYTASEAKINGEFDFYAILGLSPTADKAKIKKQYRKMAVLLHPDKNKTVGADGAFKLVSEAWTVLSDSNKRAFYDNRRNYFTAHATGVGGFDGYSKPPASHPRSDTFWTVCTSCHVQYEYLRKYVNKKLSCKNCRGVFVAVETGVAPVNGSFPYCPWSFGAAENGYATTTHGCGVTYHPSSTTYCPGNGLSAHHSGHGSEYVSNISFQWASVSGNSTGASDPNGHSVFSDAVHQVNGATTRSGSNGKQQRKNAKVDVPILNGYTVYPEQPPVKVTRPYKKRKPEGGIGTSGNSEPAKVYAEARVAMNANGLPPKPTSKPLPPVAAAPAIDMRQLLIDKARTTIRQKLVEMKLADEVAAAEAERKRKAEAEIEKLFNTPKRAVSITVPDSDFHDFDKDRSEECFKPKQIWALYDEEDGMPRLYCLIREIISVKPFKIHISYLSSKTDTEFGQVNWLDSGFTKSCGGFRAYTAEVVEQVNIFSHLLSKEKAGRGGCIRIYPRRGDIWAVYRNWSPDWNRNTPAEVRHQYEMVEVLDDYSEDIGVCVAPLQKVEGFKTVYRRKDNKESFCLIQRREMLRFSHQVPSCFLKGENFNLPDGCWDLDPAATPEQLLHETVEPWKEEDRQTEAGEEVDAEARENWPSSNCGVNLNSC